MGVVIPRYKFVRVVNSNLCAEESASWFLRKFQCGNRRLQCGLPSFPGLPRLQFLIACSMLMWVVCYQVSVWNCSLIKHIEIKVHICTQTRYAGQEQSLFFECAVTKFLRVFILSCLTWLKSRMLYLCGCRKTIRLCVWVIQ